MAQQDNINPYRSQSDSTFNESRAWNGLSLWEDRQDMSGSALLQADQVLNKAGVLFPRPGFTGLLGGSAPSSSSSSSGSGSGSASSSTSGYVDVGPVSYALYPGIPYPLCQFTDASELNWFILVAGGKIYKQLQGGTYRIELLSVGGSSYNFNSPLTTASVYGNYIYPVDGAHPATRISLTGGYPSYAMQAPTTAPTAILTNSLLFSAAQVGTAANWSFDGQASPMTNLSGVGPTLSAKTNGGYQIPAGSNLRNATYWTITGESGPGWGGDANAVNLISPTVNICVAGGSDATGGYLTVPSLSGNSLLYPSRFHIVLWQVKNDFGSNPNTYIADILITPFDSGHNQLSSAAIIQINIPGNSGSILDEIADFSGVGANVAFLKVQIVATNTSSVGNLYIDAINITPITVQTTFLSNPSYVRAIPMLSGGAINTSSTSSTSSTSGSSSGVFVPGNTPTDLGNVLDYEATSFTFTFPASSSSSGSSSGSSSSSGALTGGISLATVNRLVIGLGGIVSWAGLAFNLSLVQSNGTVVLADNGTAISSDLTGLDCDISTLTTAQRSNIVAIKLTFLVDPTWVSPFYALNLGPITLGGNLQINNTGLQLLFSYQWWITEDASIDGLPPLGQINADGTIQVTLNPSQNSIEGNPSVGSSILYPTFFQAEGQITLPSVCPVNSLTQGGSLFYQLYRRGGEWSDVRLIASVPKNADVALGADPLNPYYSWNHTTRIFIDNTPDTWLQTPLALMSFSRNPMLTNLQCCCVTNDRFYGAVGNTVAVSWLFNANNSAALMTTTVLDSTDPNAEIAGAVFPIGNDPSNTVVALVPYGTPIAAGNQFGGGVLCLMQRGAPYLIQGNAPITTTTSTQFSVVPQPYSSGAGLIAPRGYVQVTPNEIIWMGADRLHIFPPRGDSPNSDPGHPIQPMVYPAPPWQQTFMNATAVSQAWMAYHDSKIFWGMPVPGGTQNSVVWCLDLIDKGWTCAVTNKNTTGVFSAPPNSATGSEYQLYFCDTSGQVSLFNGFADTATPLSSPTAIPWAVTTHGNRPGFFYRYKLHPTYYMNARLEAFYLEVTMTGQINYTWTPYNPSPTGPVALSPLTYSGSYNLNGDGHGQRFTVPNGLVQGQWIECQISGSTTTGAIIRGVRAIITGPVTQQG